MLPKPYYSHAGITIYHADCRDILPHLDPVELVLTDPPYGINYSKYPTHKDNSKNYIEFLWPIVEVCESKINDGYFAIFQATKNLRKCGEWFPREWRPIVSFREFAQWMPTHIQFRTDFTLFWKVGIPKAWKPKNMPRDYFVSSRVCVTQGMNKRVDHPCPRPIDTMIYLVDVLGYPGGTILDPFMGSGTTLVAAKQLGRKAVGIEIEERYCEIAVQRLQQEVLCLEPAKKENKDTGNITEQQEGLI